ncbi:MAG: DUF4162 domain-containing protein, partial [Planctomycetota bacterium]
EKGHLLKSGRVEAILREMEAGIRLRIETAGDKADLERFLREHDSVASVTRLERRVECLWTEAREELPQLHRQLVAADVPIVSLAIVEENLEDIYMRISGHHTS